MQPTTEAEALSEMAIRLHERFPTAPTSTIEKVVRDYHSEFDGDPIRDFIPVLVERQAVERLRQIPLQQGPRLT
jgi:hypothetical protein